MTAYPDQAPRAGDALRQLFSLEGRCAMISGANRGIGRAVALGLAAAGADVVLIGRKPAEVQADIEALGRRVLSVELDLSNSESIAERVRAILAKVSVDILVNNAGIISRQDTVEIEHREWSDVLAINLDATFIMCQEVGRSMIERGYGKIINVASLASFTGSLRVCSYTASKHAIVGLTKALSNEWAPLGVRVNALAPGYTRTRLTEELSEDQEMARAILDRIPAGRWAEPADMVGAAVFLAAPASDYVSGHTLVVDGGWLAR